MNFFKIYLFIYIKAQFKRKDKLVFKALKIISSYLIYKLRLNKLVTYY